MRPSVKPNKPKFAKKNQNTILAPKIATWINDVQAILVFALATIIGAALITHSLNDSCWSRSFDTSVVHNKVGVVGAYLSDFLFYIFGFSAWWFVIGFIYLGYRKISRSKIETGNWVVIYQCISFVVMLTTSSALEYIIKFGQPSDLPDGFGGSFGGFIVQSFYHSVGEIGLTIIMLVLVIVTFSFTFSVSWPLIAEKLGLVLEYVYLKLTKMVERKDNTIAFDTTLQQQEPVTNIVNSQTSTVPFATDNYHSSSIMLNEAELLKDNFSNNFTDIDTPNINNGFEVASVTEQIEPPVDEVAQEKQHNFLGRLFGGNKLGDKETLTSGNDPFIVHHDIEDNDSNLHQLDDKFAGFNPTVINDTFNTSDIDELNQSPITIVPKVTQPAYRGDLVSAIGAAQLPSTELLMMPQVQIEPVTPETIAFVTQRIESSLADFGIEVSICNVESGPVITRYELVPPRGVKGEKIAGFAKEIARSLALPSVRVVENIIGKNTMGIEVPNFKRQTIYLKEIFDSKVYQDNNSLLTLALGKDIAGQVIVTDLAKMPHLLVAGTTGSGKSVSVNAMILSILFNATAEQVKFIMIDPKMVELSFYQDIPHLLAPVVTDMSQAANALKWTVGEMERRYKLMAKVGTKKLVDFNAKVEAAEKAGKPLLDPFSADLSNPEPLEKWPFIVVIIDELADLMMVAGKKIEQYIARIAQKARAVGIHLIVATQRPSADVITGLIKANIPARIAFQISSKIDSRIILDQQGAEALLGQGDMLFLNPGSGFPRRIHGAYVNDDELHRVVEFLRSQGKPNYNEEILTGDVDVIIPGVEDDTPSDSSSVEKDPIFDQSVKFILESKRCSISSLQTQFGIGYNKAARIMNHLEKIGMVRRNDRGGFELLNHTLNP